MSAKQNLPIDVFALGMANLERYYRRKLHPNDRDAYYEGIKEVGPHKWEKCVTYTMQKSKAFPRISELREWMGLHEPPAPIEEEDGFRPGTIHGLTPAELVDLVKQHADLPFPAPWKDAVEEAVYLDQPYKNPPPPPEECDEKTVMAWIKKYAEDAAAEYEKVKPPPKGVTT